MLCVLLCCLASMNLMTAPSVSLEGKSLWLMQSLPVEPWQALRAKLRMQVLLTVPPLLLCAVCAAIVYPLGPAGLLAMAVFAASYALLGALAGLTLGVKMPVLTWTDQLMPIKQSAPVMLTLFGGMGYTILLFAGFLLLPGWRLGFARIRSLLRGGQPAAMRGAAPVAAEKRRGAVCRPVTGPVPGLTFPEKLL